MRRRGFIAALLGLPFAAKAVAELAEGSEDGWPAVEMSRKEIKALNVRGFNPHTYRPALSVRAGTPIYWDSKGRCYITREGDTHPRRWATSSGDVPPWEPTA